MDKPFAGHASSRESAERGEIIATDGIDSGFPYDHVFTASTTVGISTIAGFPAVDVGRRRLRWSVFCIRQRKAVGG